MCPFCPHVGSVLARELPPGRGGLVKNGRRPRRTPQPSLDQWSIPHEIVVIVMFRPSANVVTQRENGW